jgi:hypothetical protein
MESFVRTCGYRGRPQGTRCKRTPPRRRPSAPGSTRAGVTRVSQGRLSHTRALSRGVMSPLKRSWRSHHAQQPDERGLERLEDRGLPRSRVTETLHCVCAGGRGPLCSMRAGVKSKQVLSGGGSREPARGGTCPLMESSRVAMAVQHCDAASEELSSVPSSSDPCAAPRVKRRGDPCKAAP